jgi:multiple sugar transport system ATP-binding protein
MSSLTLENITVRYGQDTVIPPLSLTTADAEFLVLLGPSGCGKSTLLRTIAGLIESTTGRVLLGGADVTDLDPRERNVAFVFQSYALYPNFSVADNIAFPLVVGDLRAWEYIPGINNWAVKRRARAAHVQSKVAEVSALLGLEEFLHRRPADLSGGQRQRVALARSLVRDPSIFLLDEPLSNLDAKLRTRLRVDIASLQRELQKTFVYVTHDQVEAMTMATQIAVMDKGVIQQVGTPNDVYTKPANLFVATFVGTPVINILDASEAEQLFGLSVPSSAAYIGIRPEALRFSRGHDGVSGTVTGLEDLGSSFEYRIDTTAGTPLTMTSARATGARVGSNVVLDPYPTDVHFFDAEGNRLRDNG